MSDYEVIEGELADLSEQLEGTDDQGEKEEIYARMEELQRELDALDPLEDEHDMFLSDAEADADVLASAGYGTDEDYGFFGDDYC